MIIARGSVALAVEFVDESALAAEGAGGGLEGQREGGCKGAGKGFHGGGILSGGKRAQSLAFRPSGCQLPRLLSISRSRLPSKRRNWYMPLRGP
ncbi:hypothetical protein Pres01_41850 [Metapseudomonas resinovorans]|nr:hypothetical protein Pres01_41850 [Pseudomonas resinovorans]